jgi:hypothetical protein
MKTILIIMALAGMALAQTTPKIDFTQILTGPDGKAISSGADAKAPSLTLGDVAVTALESALEEDKAMPGAEKFKMDELARRIYKAKAAVLSVEDVTLIKTRVGKGFSPPVVGAAWRLLDPTTASGSPSPYAGQNTAEKRSR